MDSLLVGEGLNVHKDSDLPRMVTPRRSGSPSSTVSCCRVFVKCGAEVEVEVGCSTVTWRV